MTFLEDAITRLAAVPDELDRACAGLSPEQLSWKPAPDVFSIRENIWHLRDIDIEGYEQRVRLILTVDNPALPDVNGAKLASERNYNVQPIQPAVADLRRSRLESVRLLQRCSVEELSRTAEMQGVGKVDLRRLLQLWMQHDAEHLADVRELRHAIETGVRGNHLPNTGMRADVAQFRLL